MNEDLAAEADWLASALKNAGAQELYSSEFFRGFDAAVGWVRFHAEHPELRETEEEMRDHHTVVKLKRGSRR